MERLQHNAYESKKKIITRFFEQALYPYFVDQNQFKGSSNMFNQSTESRNIIQLETTFLNFAQAMTSNHIENFQIITIMNYVRTWVGCCPGPSPALMIGMSAVTAALLAAPLSKCLITIISEYPSTVLIVSAHQLLMKTIQQDYHHVKPRSK